MNSGFFVGNTVIKKSDGTVYKIAKFDGDGNVEIQLLSKDGEPGKPLSIAYGCFIVEFRVTATTFETFADWQSKMPSVQQSYIDAKIKAYVTAALAQAGAATETQLKIQLKPTRSVYAVEAFSVGKLVLVPESNKMSMVQPHVFALESIVAIGKVKHSVWLLPAFSDTFAAVAWAVRTITADRTGIVNMTVGKKMVTITIDDTTKVVVQVPVLTNSKKLKADDELVLLYEPVAKAKAKRPPALTLQSGKAKAKRTA